MSTHRKSLGKLRTWVFGRPLQVAEVGLYRVDIGWQYLLGLFIPCLPAPLQPEKAEGGLMCELGCIHRRMPVDACGMGGVSIGGTTGNVQLYWVRSSVGGGTIKECVAVGCILKKRS